MGRGIHRRTSCARPSFLDLADLLQVGEDALGLLGVDDADGDAGVDDDVIARPRPGDAGQAHATADAGELDDAAGQLVGPLVAFNQTSGDSETHEVLPSLPLAA